MKKTDDYGTGDAACVAAANAVLATAGTTHWYEDASNDCKSCVSFDANCLACSGNAGTTECTTCADGYFIDGTKHCTGKNLLLKRFTF